VSGAGQSLLLSDQQRAAQPNPVARAPLPLPGQQPCSALQDWVWYFSCDSAELRRCQVLNASNFGK
jgi:hypothetical protein